MARSLALAALAGGIASPVAALAGHWATEGDPPFLIHALDPGAEELDVMARCDGPTITVIYVASDRPQIAAGSAADCEVERPCRENVALFLVVDGKATPATARARPEELYGGHELDIPVPLASPFWRRMAKGRALSVRLDGVEGERLSLKGASKPLARFLAACRKRPAE